MDMGSEGTAGEGGQSVADTGQKAIPQAGPSGLGDLVGMRKKGAGATPRDPMGPASFWGELSGLAPGLGEERRVTPGSPDQRVAVFWAGNQLVWV